MAARAYPYQINCTHCDTRLVAVDKDWFVLLGPRPIEVIGDLQGGAHLACHSCGAMVPLDADLLSLR